MWHARRRVDFLLQLGLKVNIFSDKGVSVVNNDIRFINKMFAGIPSYVFSKTVGSDLI